MLPGENAIALPHGAVRRILCEYFHVTQGDFQRLCIYGLYGAIQMLVLLYFLRPTSTKPQAEILKLNNVNGCNDISFGDHSILEGDRIPPLKSHGQALEEELCFPRVLSDNRDAPANLLCHFYGCLVSY